MEKYRWFSASLWKYEKNKMFLNIRNRKKAWLNTIFCVSWNGWSLKWINYASYGMTFLCVITINHSKKYNGREHFSWKGLRCNATYILRAEYTTYISKLNECFSWIRTRVKLPSIDSIQFNCSCKDVSQLNEL